MSWRETAIGLDDRVGPSGPTAVGGVSRVGRAARVPQCYVASLRSTMCSCETMVCQRSGERPILARLFSGGTEAAHRVTASDICRLPRRSNGRTTREPSAGQRGIAIAIAIAIAGSALDRGLVPPKARRSTRACLTCLTCRGDGADGGRRGDGADGGDGGDGRRGGVGSDGSVSAVGGGNARICTRHGGRPDELQARATIRQLAPRIRIYAQDCAGWLR